MTDDKKNQPQEKESNEDVVDLADLPNVAKADEGAEMKLLHPVTEEFLGAVFILVGADSEVYKKLRRKMTDKRLKQKKLTKVTAQSIDEDGLNLLVNCTVSWRNLLVNGQMVPFSQKAAREVYTEYPWIAEQANAFIGDRGNFTGNS